MAKHFVNNIRLGVFVVSGLVFLVLLLYMIGRNTHLFGSNYLLKAQFGNVQGLKPGNNVRYSGIEIGTVKKISFLNDTLVEVEMLIESKMKAVIRKNATVAVGTEGFVGNKVVNIVPGKGVAAFANSGDVLNSKGALDTDDMLRTLSRTNEDIGVIASSLKTTVQNINNSEALWQLLNEKSLPGNVRRSAENLRIATENAAAMAAELHALIEDVRNGKGSVGAILTDSSFAISLREAMGTINSVAYSLDSLGTQLNEFVATLKNDVNSGKGIAKALLTDSVMTLKFNQTLTTWKKVQMRSARIWRR